MQGDDRTVYGEIGRTYSSTRQADPRIASQIADALGNARTVLNVGAGTGNYEPHQGVVAVEPSPTMIAQRPRTSAPVVRAVAEGLPVRGSSFDAALAILTLHHWSDVAAGLTELRRVARRQVIFYFEPMHGSGYWAAEYFPTAAMLESEIAAPGAEEIGQVLDVIEVRTVAVPSDCDDGFGVAFWARPERYLDPEVQAGISWLARLPSDELDRGAAWLRSDLESGEWDRRHGHLRDLDVFDGGYRIAICGAAP